MKSVFPDAEYKFVCHSRYPIEVTVGLMTASGRSEPLWHGSQRNLFRKYAPKREVAIAEITAAAKKLKADKKW